jgi:hypothetical protein
MKFLKKWLILSHRYLGIALSLLVMMWFATGILMMYAGGMPRLAPQTRLERLPRLDVASVRLTPTEAAERAGMESPGRALLLTVLNRPAYRFTSRGSITVFADTGEVLEGITLTQAKRVASEFVNVPPERLHHVGTLTEIDQWTLTLSRQLPLHKFEVADDAGTEVYVSPDTAEVALVTTRRERALAWMSTIPHWFYFTALRSNQPVWYRFVVWTSAFVCVLAVLGLALAFTQFKRTRPFRLASAIPYSGGMRWHYVTGAVFGVFTLTFAFSGLLSMEPFAWTNAAGVEVPRDALTGGRLDLGQFASMDAVAWERTLDGRAAKEIELLRIQDQHYYAVRHTPNEGPGRRERLHQPYYITGRREPERLLIAAGTLQIRDEPFSAESVVDRLHAALPDVPIAESALLAEYDSYYYSRGRQTPLPVLRVKFADPAETWVYVDPETNQVLAAIPRLARVERWLYNGLHSLDFAFWYNQRPLWDIVMIVLCLGGLTTSTLGLVIGSRRLRRGARRTVNAVAPPQIASEATSSSFPRQLTR